MKVIFDLPDGLTEADIPALKMAITDWAKEHVKNKTPQMDIRFVRARMIERGTSLQAWARSNGFNAVHVFRSIRGDYCGPKAKRALDLLRRELPEA